MTIVKTPPAEVRAQGFWREVSWSLRHNRVLYCAEAAASLVAGFLAGHFG